MFAAILILIAAVVFGFAVYGVTLFNPEGEEDPLVGCWIATVVSGLVLAITIWCSCLVTIPTNSVGLIYAFKKLDVEHVKQPGLNFKWPWEKVSIYDMSVETMIFDDEKDHYASIGAMTKDGIYVGMYPSVPWKINPKHFPYAKSQWTAEGSYTLAVNRIARAAVRDAVAEFSWEDRSILHRDKLRKAIQQRIEADTVDYLESQGFGDRSKEMIVYGRVTLGGITLPQEIEGALARTAANRIGGRIPADLTPEQYSALIQTEAIASAVKDGKPVSVVLGNALPIVPVKQ